MLSQPLLTYLFTNNMFGVLSLYLTFGDTARSTVGQILRNKLSTRQFTQWRTSSTLTLLPFPSAQVLANSHRTEGLYKKQFGSEHLSRISEAIQETCLFSTKTSIFEEESYFKS